ncbi:polysaccharide pyruvyl transferase family protein [Methylobacterium sp. NFXW15]|uniref:polysaccharide pyruvyl transferase family protein n=1 Tax=Methylobacterium sp. NFXW15 TaxID=2819512 RepID=UPI003CEC0AB1
MNDLYVDASEVSFQFAQIRAEILKNEQLNNELHEYFSKEARFFSSGGNLGDGLIQLGTFDLFESKGIDLRAVDPNNHSILLPETPIILGGSGAWVEGVWEYWARLLRPHLEAGGKLLVLPSSFNGFVDYFERYADQIFLFAREEVSFSALAKSRVLRDRIGLCPDLAFAINPDTLPKQKFLARSGELNLFRTDAESALKRTPLGNCDVALLWNGGIWSEKVSCIEAITAACDLIGRFQVVNTDRLHMTVLSAMIGCKVNMYSGNYFKLSAVYDYTLKSISSIKYCGLYDLESQISFDENEAMREELINLARLRRDWYEPEIVRLQNLIAEYDKIKNEWFEPKLNQFHNNLEMAQREISILRAELSYFKRKSRTISEIEQECQYFTRRLEHFLGSQISLLRVNIDKKDHISEDESAPKCEHADQLVHLMCEQVRSICQRFYEDVNRIWTGSSPNDNNDENCEGR